MSIDPRDFGEGEDQPRPDDVKLVPPKDVSPLDGTRTVGNTTEHAAMSNGRNKPARTMIPSTLFETAQRRGFNIPPVALLDDAHTPRIVDVPELAALQREIIEAHTEVTRFVDRPLVREVVGRLLHSNEREAALGMTEFAPDDAQPITQEDLDAIRQEGVNNFKGGPAFPTGIGDPALDEIYGGIPFVGVGEGPHIIYDPENMLSPGSPTPSYYELVENFIQGMGGDRGVTGRTGIYFHPLDYMAESWDDVPEPVFDQQTGEFAYYEFSAAQANRMNRHLIRKLKQKGARFADGIPAMPITTVHDAKRGLDQLAQALSGRLGGDCKDTNPKDAVGTGKTPLSVVPLTVMMEVGLAMLEGARKYGRHNYRAMGIRASVYLDAIFRHAAAWWEGEDTDPDSKLSHITKIISSATVLRDAMIQDLWVDDRPPQSPNGWLSSMNEKAKEIVEKYPEALDPWTEERVRLMVDMQRHGVEHSS